MGDVWSAILVTIDTIWFYRNKLIWKNYKADPERVVADIVARCKAYNEISCPDLFTRPCNKDTTNSMFEYLCCSNSCRWIHIFKFMFYDKSWFISGVGIGNQLVQIFMEQDWLLCMVRYILRSLQTSCIKGYNMLLCNVKDVINILKRRNCPLNLFAVMYDIGCRLLLHFWFM